MKKYFISLIIISCLLLTSCGSSKFTNIEFKNTETFRTLSKVVYPDTKYTSYNYSEKIDNNNLQEFTTVLSNKLFKEKINYIFSPISLYMALSMLTEGASGETYNELSTLLGYSTLEENQKQMALIYNHNYYKNDDGCLRMANSIWIKDGFSVNDDYINILSSKYFAESYQTSFDDKGKDNIINWINNYTNNFLNLTKDNYQIDSNTAVLLLNTIYFDNKWATEFKTSNTYEDNYYLNNETVQVKYMKHKVSSIYSETDKAETITDTFKNYNYIKFILPKEGINVLDCLTQTELFGSTLEDKVMVSVNLNIPKFKFSNDYFLNDTLKEIGVNRIFNCNGEFDKINPNLYVSFIKQTAGIELNEEGVKAAAVTSTGIKCTSIEPGKEITMILNRPFIYIIYDNNNVPLFIGIVQNPNQ